MKESQGASITLVVTLLLLVAMGVGWCVFAAEYAKDVEGWKPVPSELVTNRRSFQRGMIFAMLSMIRNGVVQIPNLIPVIKFSLFQRTYASIGFAVVLSLIVAFGIGLKVLERNFDRPKRRRKSY